jgi:hypothetical protein
MLKVCEVMNFFSEKSSENILLFKIILYIHIVFKNYCITLKSTRGPLSLEVVRLCSFQLIIISTRGPLSLELRKKTRITTRRMYLYDYEE